ncbi:MAG: GxxExxY protein [Persicimonas sp.]
MGKSEFEREDYDRLSYRINGLAIQVHRHLGPGLLESAYEACMEFELQQAGLRYERQKPLPVVYKGQRLECGYRLDFVVERRIVLELKAVCTVDKIHKSQLLSYLRLGGWKLGLLLNFNVETMKNGIERVVNNLPGE